MYQRGVRFNKLILKHRIFKSQYVCSRYNRHGIYKMAYFCEDEDIAFVIRVEDYDDYEAWGCVNMAHQLLVPFKYAQIYDFGRFLIAENSEGRDLYNKKGQKLYEIGSVLKTPNKAYTLVYDSDDIYFRIAIRKIAISKGLYQNFHVTEKGLAYVQNTEGLVGLVVFSKLKLPFEYYAISLPQNGYCLGIIKSESLISEEAVYDCQLIKVRSNIKKENSIHTTGITLFQEKTKEEMEEFFTDKVLFEQTCNTIVCYNQKVNFSKDSLQFFPFDTENHILKEEDDDETEYEETDYHEDFNPWNNYTDDDFLSDALDGEPEAYWNID